MGRVGSLQFDAMKLTTKGRYAVMALADMAIAGAGRPIPLSEVGERQGISVSYLEQLFPKMRKAGLVSASRGPGGGYVLNRAPEEIRILDIMSAADEPIHTTQCEPGSQIGCRGDAARCLTHDLWDELGRQIELFLGGVTLSDVVERRLPSAVRPVSGVLPEMSLDAGRRDVG